MTTRAAPPATAQAAWVRWFDDIGIGDVPAVGGKNASLGEMRRALTRLGVRIPDGFATTADAYRAFLRAGDLEFGGLIAPIPDVIAATIRGFVWRFGTDRTSARPVNCVDRIRRSSRRFLCGLSGHDMLRRFEADRLCLECARCGAQTPGWRIDVDPRFRRRTKPVVTRGPRRVTDAPIRSHERGPDSPPAKAA